MSELLTIENGQASRKELPSKSYKSIKYYEMAGRVFGIANEHDNCLVQAVPAEFANDLAHDLDWYSSAIYRRPTITIPCGIFEGLKPATISKALNEVNNFIKANSQPKQHRPVVIFRDVDALFDSAVETVTSNQLNAPTLVTGYMGSLAMAESSKSPLLYAISPGNIADMPGTDSLLEIFDSQCVITSSGGFSFSRESEDLDQPTLSHLDRIVNAKLDIFRQQVAMLGLNQAVEV